MWLYEASCFPSGADRLCHTCTEARCYLSPWRCQNAGYCSSVIHSHIVFCGECTQGCSLSSAKPSSWRLHPPTSGRILFVHLHERVRALWLGGFREGRRIQITFNFIRMNSWHSQERAAELCDAAAAWRGRLASSRGFVVQLEQNPWFIPPLLSTSYQFRGEYKQLFPPCTIFLNPLKWRLRLFRRGLKQRNPAGFKIFILIRNSW